MIVPQPYMETSMSNADFQQQHLSYPFVRPPAEPSFRPDPRALMAAACRVGQGWPDADPPSGKRSANAGTDRRSDAVSRGIVAEAIQYAESSDRRRLDHCLG
jgi:hypothetical protein